MVSLLVTGSESKLSSAHTTKTDSVTTRRGMVKTGRIYSVPDRKL